MTMLPRKINYKNIVKMTILIFVCVPIYSYIHVFSDVSPKTCKLIEYGPYVYKTFMYIDKECGIIFNESIHRKYVGDCYVDKQCHFYTPHEINSKYLDTTYSGCIVASILCFTIFVTTLIGIYCYNRTEQLKYKYNHMA